MKILTHSFICLCLITSIAQAKTIYKHIDSNGTIVFTDKPSKTIKQEKMIIKVENDPAAERQITALKQKLQHRKPNSRQRQINAAKLKLREAEMQLSLMQKRDRASYKKCLKKKAELKAQEARNIYYVCQHASMLEYQQAVVDASRQLKKVQLQS